jgi:hypothetical protein
MRRDENMMPAVERCIEHEQIADPQHPVRTIFGNRTARLPKDAQYAYFIALPKLGSWTGPLRRKIRKRPIKSDGTTQLYYADITIVRQLHKLVIQTSRIKPGSHTGSIAQAPLGSAETRACWENPASVCSLQEKSCMLTEIF